MIRILHIVNRVVPDGATKQLTQLLGAIGGDRFESRVCSLGKSCTDLCLPGIAEVSAGRRGRVDPLALHRLRKHIRQLQPDIIHAWQFDASVYARLAATRADSTRLIVSRLDAGSGRGELEWAIDRRLSGRDDRIVTSSVAARDFLAGRGLPLQKLQIIPKAVQPAKPARLPRSEFLAQLGLPTDAKLILYLGSLAKQKRLKELIWATDQLKAVGVPAHLLLVGDGPLRWRLERYRWQNRIEDRVHFLGRQNDVSEPLAHADVLWQAEAGAGQSSAVLEAMAAGVPVVAADGAGNRELVRQSETGYLVPLNERAGFARSTLPLLEDPLLARQIGDAGRQRVQQNHAIENIAPEYARLYRRVIG